jgi:hypothetical protein
MNNSGINLTSKEDTLGTNLDKPKDEKPLHAALISFFRL